MTFWFTTMLLIVGSGDDTGKSRRYKTGSLEPAASFLHMSLSTGSSLVGLPDGTGAVTYIATLMSIARYG